MGQSGASQRRGDLIHRRRVVRREQAGNWENRREQWRARRPAQDQSPIIVFCSFGDDITPPQQALDWILDLYDDVDDLIANGQTIIYSLHQSIGHLGIFVSGKVAKKEHEEFVLNMNLIDVMPPGLYEVVLTEADGTVSPRDLVEGKYIAKARAAHAR